MPYENPADIPEPDTATYRGVCVYVPDLPEYRTALLGAIGFFGTWVAWKRDAQKSALRSAALWKRAHELTVAEWDNECRCQDMCDCERIRIIIREELENMAINNNVTVNCGCGCGSGSGSGSGNSDAYPPPGQEVPPMPPINPDAEIPPDTQDFRDYTCNAAHYLAYLIRLSLMDASQAWHSSLTFRLQLINAAIGYLVQPPYGGGDGSAQQADLSYWTYLTMQFPDGDELTALIAEWDRNHNDVVCALYSGATPTQKRTDTLSVIEGMNLTRSRKTYIEGLMSVIDFVAWFAPGNFEGVDFPAGYTDRECECGGYANTYPEAPSGYRWRVGSQEWYSAGGGVTHVQYGHVIDVSVPVSGDDRFAQMRYLNYNTSGVYGIAVFMEDNPADLTVGATGWYQNALPVASDEGVTRHVFFANKGAPVIEWGEWTVHENTKSLVIDLGRIDFDAGGGLFRFTCFELVPA